MNYSQRLLSEQSAKAEQMFRARSYAEQALASKTAASLLCALFPVLSVVAGCYHLLGILGLPMGLSVALGAAILGTAEYLKATHIRQSVRSLLQGDVSVMGVAVALLLTACTAYLAAQGASSFYTAQALPSEQADNRLHDLQAQHAQDMASLQQQAEGLAAIRWPSREDRQAMLAIAQTQQQNQQHYQRQLEELQQQQRQERAAVGSTAQEVWALVLLLEVAILLCNAYVVRYYWKVHSEGKEAKQELQEDKYVEDFVRRVGERRKEVQQARAIGFQQDPEHEKKRRFFQMWAGGERNPRAFCQEIRISLQQYAKFKKDLNLQ